MSVCRKKSGKSNIMVSDVIEIDDDEIENANLQARQQQKTSQISAKINQQNPSTQKSKSVTVAENISETNTTAVYQTCIVNLDKLFKVSDHISWMSQNPADKHLGAALKNCWGRIIQPTLEHELYDKMLQDVLLKWAQGVQSARMTRGPPLCYQCRICEKAWWTLHPFKEHIRKHELEILHVYHLDRYDESYIIADASVNMSQRFIPIEGNCPQCGQDSNFHEQHYRTCEQCWMKLPNCTLYMYHIESCGVTDKNVSKKPSFCNICLIDLKNKARWLTHMKSLHVVRSDVPMPRVLRKCSYCHKSYHVYQIHPCSRNIHTQSCKYCYRKFFSGTLLDLHMKDEKEFECKYCLQVLDRRCMETEHMLIHTDEYVMVYKCNLNCSPSILFPDFESVNAHRLLHHGAASGVAKIFCEKVIVPKKCLEYRNLSTLDKSDFSRKPSSSRKKKAKEQPPEKDILYDDMLIKQEIQTMKDMETTTSKVTKTNQDNIDYEQLLSSMIYPNTTVSQEKTPFAEVVVKAEPIEDYHEIDKDGNMTSFQIDETSIKIEPMDIEMQALAEMEALDSQMQALNKMKALERETEAMEIKIEALDVKTEPVFQLNKEVYLIDSDSDDGDRNIDKVFFGTDKIVKTDKNDDNDDKNVVKTDKNVDNDDKNVDKSDKNFDNNDKNVLKTDNNEKNVVKPVKNVVKANKHVLKMDKKIIKIDKRLRTEKYAKTDKYVVKTDKNVLKIVDADNTNKNAFPADRDVQVTVFTYKNQEFIKEKIVLEVPKMKATQSIIAPTMESKIIEPTIESKITELTVESKITEPIIDNELSKNEPEKANLMTENEPKQSKVKKNTNVEVFFGENSGIHHSSDSEGELYIDENVADIITVDVERIDEIDQNIDENSQNNDENSQNIIKNTQNIVENSQINDENSQNSDENVQNSDENSQNNDDDENNLNDDIVEYKWLDVHRNKKGKGKLYTCGLCGFRSTHMIYRLHKDSLCRIKTEHIKTKYTCTKCNKTFSNMDRYVSHFQEHGFPKNGCPFCLRACENKMKILLHVQSHVRRNYYGFHKYGTKGVTQKKFPCKYCCKLIPPSRIFTHWESHITLDHDTAAAYKPPKPRKFIKLRKVEPLTSEEASVSFMRNDIRPKRMTDEQLDKMLSFLGQRLRGEERACFICIRHFERHTDLQRHLVQHLLQDAHAKRIECERLGLGCQVCGVLFERSETYKCHMREHAGMRVIKCLLCGRTFSDSSNYCKHTKTHGGIKVFICDVCQKRFHKKETLEKHVVMHLNTKPFECAHCPKVFHVRSMFKKHMVSHERKLPMRCTYCYESFATCRDKWEHMWLVHGLRKENADCPYCDESFRKRSDVVRHVRSVHGKWDIKASQVTVTVKEEPLE